MNDTALDECVPEEEIPYNGRDEDCDGADLVDADGDGADATRVGGDDCDDADPAVSPAAGEACANLVDDDCDGVTDEGCEVAPAGPPDPGGIYWVCGPPTGPSWLLLGVAAACVLRRRWRVG